MARRRPLLRGLGTGALALVAGCSGGGGSGGRVAVETSTVTMAESQFDPRNVRVETGTELTWRNEDGTTHTVTAASDALDVDAEVSGGESTTHRFESSGVYGFYCRFHGSPDLSGMSMKVAVGDAAIEDPLGGGGGGGGGAYG